MSEIIRARLVRSISVHLRDLSLSGCAVTLDEHLDPGTIGDLQVRLDGKTYSDRVQVVRAVRQYGSDDASRVGVEFAWGNRLGTASVRGTVPSAARKRGR